MELCTLWLRAFQIAEGVGLSGQAAIGTSEEGAEFTQDTNMQGLDSASVVMASQYACTWVFGF